MIRLGQVDHLVLRKLNRRRVIHDQPHLELVRSLWVLLRREARAAGHCGRLHAPNYTLGVRFLLDVTRLHGMLIRPTLLIEVPLGALTHEHTLIVLRLFRDVILIKVLELARLVAVAL